MKKRIIGILLFIITITLSGCKKNYFNAKIYNTGSNIIKKEFLDNNPLYVDKWDHGVEGVDESNPEDKTFIVKRVIDRKIVDLNNEGYLNGHTPFSAIVAFVSYLCAYLSGKKYIVLSNEDSANESTVIGTSVNHQYSKTYEFENDFNNYTNKYFGIDIKYFSLLRPLTEFQIGMLFSKLDKFHKVFKSCNLGSKGDTWEWCCKCPKCLFVFIILSPFLYKDKLIDIFGCDLYEDASLLDTFKELLGYSETKPFECVGTYGEVRFAVSLLIDKLEDDLPYLLRYYKDNYPLSLDTDYRLHYNLNNNLDSSFESIVKDAISNV
jgi:superoxide dismutase